MAVSHRMYARALFEAADGEDKLEIVHEQLGDFVAAVEAVPELSAVLTNPELDAADKKAVLEEVLGGADERVHNLVLLAAEKGRGGELPEIYREFDALVAARARRLTVELTTAIELTEDEARAIVGQIEQASGRTVEATRRVDPALIGGFVLQAGSLRVDASVRGRLAGLRHELAARG
ncbi:MAG TPA: ATP synthase F1 subunit delta [Gaiellaceae bacterium]|jgi:F-type H+-transporting ATPase subunit delta|nr:ATP synthase F1 subunit delta [Gaiellaceae bacterium]